jgi:hypothetical protein
MLEQDGEKTSWLCDVSLCMVSAPFRGGDRVRREKRCRFCFFLPQAEPRPDRGLLPPAGLAAN